MFPWPPTRRDLALFGGFAAALFITWLPRLVPGSYSIDDYALLHLNNDLGPTLRQEIGQGRFGQALIHQLLYRLGADPVQSGTLLAFAAIFVLAACAVITMRIWDLHGSTVLSLIAGSLVFVHPFAAELWSFRLAPIFFALALLPALLAILLLRRTSSGFALPIALIAGSLGIYQVNLNPLLVVILLGAALDLARIPAKSEGATRNVLRVWMVIFGCVLAAALLYFAANKLVLLAMGVPPEARAGLVPIGEVPHRLREVAALLPRLLFKERQLGTGLLGALQIALLALALALAILHSLAERSARRLLVTALLLAAALVSIIGVVALVRIFWPAPRVLTAAGFFWAGVLALCCVRTEPRARAAALGLGGLLLFGAAGIDHRAAAEQQRLNLRDLLKMTRMLERLERLPAAQGVHRLFVVNAPASYGDLKTVVGDLNVSGFYKTWSWAGMVAEAGGPWVELAKEDDRAKATAYCAKSGHWPAEGAVAIDGELAVICF